MGTNASFEIQLAVAALRVSERHHGFFEFCLVYLLASTLWRGGLHARISLVFPECATCLVFLPDQVGYICCAATIELHQ